MHASANTANIIQVQGMALWLLSMPTSYFKQMFVQYQNLCSPLGSSCSFLDRFTCTFQLITTFRSLKKSPIHSTKEHEYWQDKHVIKWHWCTAFQKQNTVRIWVSNISERSSYSCCTCTWSHSYRTPEQYKLLTTIQAKHKLGDIGQAFS